MTSFGELYNSDNNRANKKNNTHFQNTQLKTNFITVTYVLLCNSIVNPKHTFIYIIKGDMFVCLLPMAGRMAGPITTKLGIGTQVDPGSVLVKVKVKVIWRHLANANKTPYRGPQGPREFEREAR